MRPDTDGIPAAEHGLVNEYSSPDKDIYQVKPGINQVPATGALISAASHIGSKRLPACSAIAIFTLNQPRRSDS